MSRTTPILTTLGTLHKRTCIYLDRVTFDYSKNTLELGGDIDRTHCMPPLPPGNLILYSLRFNGVLAMKMIEYDSWHGPHASSFDEIQDSVWLRSLGGKVDSHDHHYVVHTYDDVFEVVCSGYEFVADPNVDPQDR